MPPKGLKRKAVGDANDVPPLLPPNRNNWPGWVELESEPAIFDMLLKDMGVRGLTIREVHDLDNFKYTLPLPIHGLIFLFQYNNNDQSTSDAGGHVKDVWFANQVPEYACASIAILNIVNNIPSIDLGKELRDFKEFTQDMDPLMRGDTIDSFDFVKRIHNSFARETDMLNADMVTQDKVHRVKKELAKEKARETREANKAAKATKASLGETSANGTRPSTNGTGRQQRRTARQSDTTSTSMAARKGPSTVISSPSDSSEDPDQASSSKLEAKANDNAKSSLPPRRSGRAPKPRKVITTADFEEKFDAGFHYVAYVPVSDHVWKLDGMDRYPQDLGIFGQGDNGADGGSGDWLDVVTPIIRNQMRISGEVQYSLMAVVRDPFFDEQRKLLENVKALQAVDCKLDSSGSEWKAFEGGETRKDVITGISVDFDIAQKDVDDAELPHSVRDMIANEDDILKLIEHRQGLLKEQTMLRSGLRDARQHPDVAEDARLRKHDFGPFVREWLSALAEVGVLHGLIS